MPLAHARHILVKTKDEAVTIKQQLADGGDFAALAKKHSTGDTAKGGGSLGEFAPGKMVKAVDNVIFKKPVLVVHGPVKTKFGFHLVQTIYRT
jgi:peptidyl-prolyl cis-trans isomerase C